MTQRQVLVVKHRGRQCFVNAATTRGGKNMQKIGPHVSGSEDAISSSVAQGSEHVSEPPGPAF